MKKILYYQIRFVTFAKEHKFNVPATSIKEAIEEIEKKYPITFNDDKRNYYVDGVYDLIEEGTSNIFIKVDKYEEN